MTSNGLVCLPSIIQVLGKFCAHEVSEKHSSCCKYRCPSPTASPLASWFLGRHTLHALRNLHLLGLQRCGLLLAFTRTDLVGYEIKGRVQKVVILE